MHCRHGASKSSRSEKFGIQSIIGVQNIQLAAFALVLLVQDDETATDLRRWLHELSERCAFALQSNSSSRLRSQLGLWEIAKRLVNSFYSYIAGLPQ